MNIFAYDWFLWAVRPEWIKRELGESPKQSRCCEALFNALTKLKPLGNTGKESRARVSQKTCHRVLLISRARG